MIKELKNVFHKDTLKTAVKRTVKAMQKEGVSGLPAQIAFYFLWSLIPLVVTVSVITGFFDFANESIVEYLKSNPVGELSDILLPYFVNNKTENINFVFLLLPIYLGSKSFNSLIVVTEVMYGYQGKGFLFKRLYACFLMFAFIVLLVFLIFIPTFGAKIFMSLFDLLKLDDFWLRFFVIFRWPISIIIIYLGILSLYISTLEFRIPARKLGMGALFTTLGWTIASFIFEFYMTNIADFSIYGSFSNIVTLILWFYVLSYIFVLGIAINIGFDGKVKI